MTLRRITQQYLNFKVKKREKSDEIKGEHKEVLAFFLFGGHLHWKRDLQDAAVWKRKKGMKIHFQNIAQTNADPITSYRTYTENQNTAVGRTKDISDRVVNQSAYDFSKSQGIHGWNGEDLKNAAGADDVSQMHNFMAVMSNSLSDEDFAKLQKEGYDPSEMDAEDIITILDTIKAELLKAGVHVIGYTDEITCSTLSEITGSEGYARQLREEDLNKIKESFAREDIPLTEKNLSDAADAWKRGMELTELSSGNVKFMLTNELSPSIDNLYLAEHAGTRDEADTTGGYFKEDMPGYYGQRADTYDQDALKEQMGEIIESAGYTVSEDSLDEAGWLVENGIPLTQQTFTKLHTLHSLQFPMSEDRVLSSVIAAMADGKEAGDALLTETKSVYRKAVDTLADYENRYSVLCMQTSPSPEQITAKRQLEEVRLYMTVEANVKLLKSGFAIDTAPIEETIQALKAMESNASGLTAEQSPVDLTRETLRKTAEIPYMPAATIGRMLSLNAPVTVDGLYETGTRLREAYKAAGEAYETMFTVPTAEYGDTINKAFRNVDELLSGMGMELTDENRKALRSLSYNHTDLTVENIQAVKGASGVVARVVEKMTPMSVLKMIKDGINPLRTTMEELEEYLDGQDTYEEDSEKYSRFLYRMEQSKEITPEEKESFIGIYRLLRQIEKTDGAAVGKIVDTKAELTFRNLLSAVRTGKTGGIDISVNGSFGSLSEALEKGISIDTQIDSAYNSQMLKEFRQMDSSDSHYENELRQLNQPVTIQNLMALKAMDQDALKPFTRIDALERRYGKESHLKKNIELFSDDTVFQDRASLQEAYTGMLSEYEQEAKELTFSEKAQSMDIRALQLSCKQLTIKSAYAQNEEYDIPCLVDNELTSIHLKLIHDDTDRGHIYVSTETKVFGTLAGDFTLTDGEVSGILTAGSEGADKALQKAEKQLKESLQKKGMSAGSIKIVTGVSQITPRGKKSEGVETAKLYQAAGIIVSVLRSVAETERTENYENKL